MKNGQLTTRRGYIFAHATSAMQKAVRRNDARTAGYFAVELYMSGYRDYVWKRLFTISVEDCWGIITKELEAIHAAWQRGEFKKSDPKAGRIYVSKAIILLCQAQKCRDADHLTNLVYDRNMGGETEVCEHDDGVRMPVPEYALDCHTREGKRAGKTKDDFFTEEFQALQPKAQGEFDGLVSQLFASRRPRLTHPE